MLYTNDAKIKQQVINPREGVDNFLYIRAESTSGLVVYIVLFLCSGCAVSAFHVVYNR